MQAILAICHRDGEAIDPPRTAAMLSSMAHRPRERVGTHSARGLWLSALAWPTSVRERNEEQPLRLRQDGVDRAVVVLDGRIDNREELLSALSLHSAEQVMGDVQLLLQVYRRWGIDGFSRLIGDFALVLYDHDTQTMIAARDPSGVRPLFAATLGRCVLLSTEPAALHAAGASHEPDENSVVERLLNTVRGNQRTLYRDVRRIPPRTRLGRDAHQPTSRTVSSVV